MTESACMSGPAALSSLVSRLSVGSVLVAGLMLVRPAVGQGTLGQWSGPFPHDFANGTPCSPPSSGNLKFNALHMGLIPMPATYQGKNIQGWACMMDFSKPTNATTPVGPVRTVRFAIMNPRNPSETYNFCIEMPGANIKGQPGASGDIFCC